MGNIKKKVCWLHFFNLKKREETVRFSKNCKIFEWNSFVLNINLNKNSFCELNGFRQEFNITKESFQTFINDKQFYAKFGINKLFFTIDYINIGDKESQTSFKGLIANFSIINTEINEEIFKDFAKKVFCDKKVNQNFNETYIIPLKTFQDIDNWTPNDDYNIATVPLKKMERNKVFKILKL